MGTTRYNIAVAKCPACGNEHPRGCIVCGRCWFTAPAELRADYQEPTLTIDERLRAQRRLIDHIKAALRGAATP